MDNIAKKIFKLQGEAGGLLGDKLEEEMVEKEKRDARFKD